MYRELTMWDKGEFMLWDDFNCPYCGAEIVSPAGERHSDILIVGEFPGDEEIAIGLPMVGKMGMVLRQELSYIGLDFNSFRRTNLWIHKPNRKEECFKLGVESLLKEAKGKRVILLLGSDTVKYFTGKSVSDVSGLRVKSHLLSAPIIIAGYNPAIVFHGVVGELRFMLREFKKAIEESEGENVERL